MKSLINASFHQKKNSLINAVLFCFHLLSPPSLPLLHHPSSLPVPPPPPPPAPSTSGICLSVAQLSRACEVEMSCSISQIKMRLLGCSGWFFPLLEPGRQPERERLRHTRTKRQIYTAVALWGPVFMVQRSLWVAVLQAKMGNR